MQLKTGQKAWKISKRRFSQTVRKQFATIANFAMCWQPNFALRNPIAPVHCTLRKIASHKTYAKFRIAKIRSEFANQFRNANISQCQIRNANFAMPISQCQIQFRNAKFKFAMPIHCSFVSQSKPLRNFALRNSQPTLRKFANPFRIAKFTAFAKFTFTSLVILCN